jgi:hypothetical protein
MWWRKLKKWAFGPESRFELGDSVQPVKGSGELMIVVEKWTSRKVKEPLITCKWNVLNTSEIRTNIFLESQLRYYNWNVKSETFRRLHFNYPTSQSELKLLMSIKKHSRVLDSAEWTRVE